MTSFYNSIVRCPNPSCQKKHTAPPDVLKSEQPAVCPSCNSVFDAKNCIELQQPLLFGEDIMAGQRKKTLSPFESPQMNEEKDISATPTTKDNYYKPKHNVSLAIDPHKYQQTLFASNQQSNRFFSTQFSILLGVATISVLLTIFIYWFFQPNPATGYSRFFCTFSECISKDYIDLSAYYEITGEISISATNQSNLIAKIELYNKHTIALPLPNIVVYFTNDAGVREAGREFEPDTYLGATEVDNIKINGQKKVSFVLSFLRPNIELKNFELKVNNPN